MGAAEGGLLTALVKQVAFQYIGVLVAFTAARAVMSAVVAGADHQLAETATSTTRMARRAVHSSATLGSEGRRHLHVRGGLAPGGASLWRRPTPPA